MTDAFSQAMTEGYGFPEPALVLGSPLLDGKVASTAHVRVPLAMLNRHGLVAGATGTGKTKTLQLLTEQLSRAGVPVFCADMKGDLTGLCVAGQTNVKIEARAEATGIPWQPSACPVELSNSFIFVKPDVDGSKEKITPASFVPP